VLLELLRGEEDLHQAPRDVAHRELPESLRLRRVARLRSFLDADAHRLERLLRRRIAAARLPQEVLARALEDEAAAERVLLRHRGEDLGIGDPAQDPGKASPEPDPGALRD